mmetsp:Transcript_16505/g.24763  ORF Transcript_16505/g.24763 Transcript_16505/m.24763 type:complete len:337 (+) Transcript_16505:113-1123(+)
MISSSKLTVALVISLNIFILKTCLSFSPSPSTPLKKTPSSSVKLTSLNMKTIDSHLHIWGTAADAKGSYPYASADQTPPPSLIDTSSASSLLTQMEENGVDGALIVQPINYKYDHRYVADAIAEHPDKLKGMLLLDPSLNEEESLKRLDELILKGFVGVRYNPYLFEGDNKMRMSDNAAAKKVFHRCGELKVPVGVMCFKGMELHYEDIIALCESSPETVVILDHFGFAAVDNQEQFQMVLDLAKYNVIVKISALFRLNDEYPFDRVQKERFDKLLEVYGAERLMFGTDFPFVMDQDFGYKGAVELVRSWTAGDETVTNAVMGGTAERLFGAWGGR